MNTDPIKANDFDAQWLDIESDALAAIRRVGESGWYILGREVDEFERALALLHGVDHVVGCASGLDAIEIGLRASGVAPGDRVLTTPLTAFATALAALRAGADLVFADVDEQGLLDLGEVESVLEAATGPTTILPVHLYGHAADIDGLLALGQKYGCVVLEDAAQAVCGAQGSRPFGSVSVGAATSFYPTKNLGALGDGGALLTSDERVARKARELRDYGQSDKYLHTSLGLNSRLDEIHAAVLRSAMLPRLPRALSRRAEIAARYQAGIERTDLRLPAAGLESSWHLFPVFANHSDGRESLREHLAACEIATAVHYPTLVTDQPALAEFEFGEFPVAARLASTELSLPIHPYLDDADVDRVIDAVNGWRHDR